MIQKCKQLIMNVNNMKTFLVIFLVILFNHNMSFSQLRSGIYSNSLMLGIDKQNKKISGYLWRNIYEDDDPKKGIYVSCYLFFKGSFSSLSKPIKVSFYNSFDSLSVSEGVISYDKNELMVKMNKKVISCQNVFDLTNGESFELSKFISISSCKIIKTNKAFFYKNSLKTKTYLVKGDFVAIVKYENDFFHIYYFNKDNKLIEGIIKKTDVELD